MIIKELTLNNVGVFNDETTISFSSEVNKPVTLIGGKNGSGKTTILESFLLVLYGNRSRNSLNFNSYSDHLRDLIHKNKKEAAITLIFQRQELGQTREYCIKRSWSCLESESIKEELTINIDGEYDESISKSWPEYVEQVLPESLSGLFIFDGEKIEKLADTATSTQALKASLYGLLGLDLVDQLKKDLVEYKRRLVLTIPDENGDSDHKELLTLETELAEIKNNISISETAIEEFKLDLERSNNLLIEAKNEFSKAGGDIFESREETLVKLTEAKVRYEETISAAFALSSGQLPLIINKSLLNKITDIGEATRKAEESEVLLRNFKKRDEGLLLTLSKTSLFNDDQMQLIDKFLTDDRSNYESSYIPPFEVSYSVLKTAKDLISAGGESLKEDLKNIVTQTEHSSNEITSYENVLSMTPDANEIVALLEDLKIAENEVANGLTDLENAEKDLNQLERRYEEKMRVFEKLANSVFDSDSASTRAARINREISKARNVLENFENRIIKKNIENIQSDILSALTLLNRKKSLVAEISIDPDTLKVDLKDPTGKTLKSERLSAGERQLFATALLWGLSKSTGKSLPTIVDTPIARLDSSHRKHLVENYFPNASHQVILLSTDEEIVGDYYDSLSSSIGKTYLMEFDEGNSSSTAKQGYFQ